MKFMKDILKVIVYIIVIIIITLICLKIFIKPNILNFKETKEFKYIERNKDNISDFIVKTDTLLGEHCYKIDINKGYEFLNNIIIKSESKYTCTDSDYYLEVYFKNGTNKKILFECDNLVYDGIRYQLKDKLYLVNKDEYIPDKIIKGTIIISNDDKVECK